MSSHDTYEVNLTCPGSRCKSLTVVNRFDINGVYVPTGTVDKFGFPIFSIKPHYRCAVCKDQFIVNSDVLKSIGSNWCT